MAQFNCMKNDGDIPVLYVVRGNNRGVIFKCDTSSRVSRLRNFRYTLRLNGLNELVLLVSS